MCVVEHHLLYLPKVFTVGYAKVLPNASNVCSRISCKWHNNNNNNII